MLGVELDLNQYLRRCEHVMAELNRAEIEQLATDLFGAWANERFVFVCGNGGAGSTAGHFAEDLLKSTLDQRDFKNDDAKRMKVLSLSENTSSILAWANDEGFDRIFVEQLKNFASPGDLLITMSGSGNSCNVLHAVDWANQHGLISWGLTGYDGGELRHLAQKNLHVPVDDMGMAQSMHLLLFHWLLDDVHARINHKGRYASLRRNRMRPEMDENVILDYFESPEHRGVLELATHQQYLRNPACGDELTLQLQADEERISIARFKASGCMISQAAASMLCEYVEQKRLDDLAEFQAEDMLNLIGVPLTPRRQQCGLLPFKALKTIVYSAAKV